MPILNRNNVVIGVAQIINKKTGTHEFTAKDINVEKIRSFKKIKTHT